MITSILIVLQSRKYFFYINWSEKKSFSGNMSKLKSGAPPEFAAAICYIFEFAAAICCSMLIAIKRSLI